MAEHNTKDSMQREALKEMVEVAQYCIDFDKSKDSRWKGCAGCYGYPGASLLLSIVDTIGSIIMGGGDDIDKHFQILNDKEWYDLQLSPVDLILIVKAYRNTLSHNGYIRSDVKMAPGDSSRKVLEVDTDKRPILFLIPFLNKSIFVVNKFLGK